MTAVKSSLNLTLRTRPTPTGLGHVYKLQFCHDIKKCLHVVYFLS